MPASMGTAAPTASTSMSTKLLVSLRVKYSSPMLRPPITATAPSATKSLLCILWLRRVKSLIDARYFPASVARAQQNGLNRRTSTFGNPASPRNIASLPAV